jgi:N-acetylneuraminic acid mutarotase
VPTYGAPAARDSHTAVWTGAEMIVWGGYYYDTSYHYLNDGARYKPAANSWATVSGSGLAPRGGHTAVWTDSEMVVWGGTGTNGYCNEGGRFNPLGNSWTAMTTNGAPIARVFHTAVWTGIEMIVWGGFNISGGDLNEGGGYNPSGNSWSLILSSLPNTPAARRGQTVVWTGIEMIVWGGFNYNGNFYFNDTFSYTPGRVLYLYQRP